MLQYDSTDTDLFAMIADLYRAVLAVTSGVDDSHSRVQWLAVDSPQHWQSQWHPS
jgi:hypothetical protein